MKKAIYLIILAVSLTSCERKIDDRIIGHWFAKNGDVCIEMEIAENRIGLIRYTRSTKSTKGMEFIGYKIHSVEGNKVKILFSDPENTILTLELTEDGNTFFIVESFEHERFDRIK